MIENLKASIWKWKLLPLSMIGHINAIKVVTLPKCLYLFLNLAIYLALSDSWTQLFYLSFGQTIILLFQRIYKKVNKGGLSHSVDIIIWLQLPQLSHFGSRPHLVMTGLMFLHLSPSITFFLVHKILTNLPDITSLSPTLCKSWVKLQNALDCKIYQFTPL